jgi:hypothetical protein
LHSICKPLLTCDKDYRSSPCKSRPMSRRQFCCWMMSLEHLFACVVVLVDFQHSMKLFSYNFFHLSIFVVIKLVVVQTRLVIAILDQAIDWRAPLALWSVLVIASFGVSFGISIVLLTSRLLRWQPSPQSCARDRSKG